MDAVNHVRNLAREYEVREDGLRTALTTERAYAVRQAARENRLRARLMRSEIAMVILAALCAASGAALVYMITGCGA